MLSIYQSTNQGKRSRSKLLIVLEQRDGLNRNELVKESGLTYEQVRRQTQNLSIEGKIRSRIESGQRRYYLAVVAIFVLFIPILTPMIDDNSVSDDRSGLINS